MSYLFAQVSLAVVAQDGGPGGMLSPILMFAIMFGVIYLLLIRPQQKQQKKLREMLGNLKKGDQVVTNGGILGRVVNISENIITLEVDTKVNIRILRAQIAGMQGETGGEADKSAGDKGDKK